ncbi:CLUMA_CG006539, isoform A [Clunio marinus]|uniref:CLUMA_CG006539, isoform A n=1 Tax=Clunio marinus TaxID=568069 RepID=A0A1J1I085_9DIPT|nr:CLUMA_CG006539, isoform A [Clunio marinus]
MELNKILTILVFSLFLTASSGTHLAEKCKECRDCDALQSKVRELNVELGNIREDNDAALNRIMSSDDMAKFIRYRQNAEDSGNSDPTELGEMRKIVNAYYESDPSSEAWQMIARNTARTDEIEESFKDMMNDSALAGNVCYPCNGLSPFSFKIRFKFKVKCCPLVIEVGIEIEF